MSDEPDLAGRFARLAAAFDHADPAKRLRATSELAVVSRWLEHDAVAYATERGWSYAEIARLLGVTRQAVRAKHLTQLLSPRHQRAEARLAQIEALQRAADERQRALEAWLARWRGDQPA